MSRGPTTLFSVENTAVSNTVPTILAVCLLFISRKRSLNRSSVSTSCSSVWNNSILSNPSRTYQIVVGNFLFSEWYVYLADKLILEISYFILDSILE